jgi:putative hydrolase of the HAD superfamily
VDPEEHRPRSFDRIAEAARLLGVEEGDLRAHWEAVVGEVATTPQRPALLLARACPSPPSDAVLDEVDEALGRFQDLALANPLPGAVEAVRELRGQGLRIGLLSNAHERDVRHWPESPLSVCFDAVVFSCFAGVMKPDVAAYLAVLGGLGVTASRAVFVGDGNSGEFTGARRAGFARVIAVTGPALRSGFRSAEEMADIAAEADAEISDVAALRALLRS